MASSSGPHAGQELVDLGAKGLGLAGQFTRRRLDLGGRGPGVVGGRTHAARCWPKPPGYRPPPARRCGRSPGSPPPAPRPPRRRPSDLVDLEMVLVIDSMAETASCVAAWMPAICAPISSVRLAVWLARFLTSEATTAKPLPASPALAASMVAFKAKGWFCSAMSVINATTSPILLAARARPCTLMLVRSASLTAAEAIWEAWSPSD